MQPSHLSAVEVGNESALPMDTGPTIISAWNSLLQTS